MFRVVLQSGYGMTTMILTAVVAIGLAVWFYRGATSHLSHVKRWTLLGLRVAAVVLVLLLLFRPEVQYTKTVETRPGLVILLDRSASMQVADDVSGRSRFDLAREAIRQWDATLGDDFDISIASFSVPMQRLAAIDELQTLSPDGKATSLERAVRLSDRVFSSECEPRAVILVSDGIHNATKSPSQAAESSKVPIHTVGVGGSLSGEGFGRDVRLVSLDMPQRLILNNLAKATGTVEATGLGGRIVTAVLERDGKVVGQQELALDDRPGLQNVTFEFRPDEKGRHTYTVRIESPGDERIVENNARSAVAQTVESGLRVFYIEKLRPEYGALVGRFLSKDPDVEFYALALSKPNVFESRSNIPGMKLDTIPKNKEAFDTFDVFLIGDLDSSYLSTEQQEWIVQRVRDGGGLVMLGGYHSLGPGGYEKTPLGRILPVELGSRDIGQITTEFLPELTPEGTRHPIFANITEFFPTATGPPKQPGLPNLIGCTRVGVAKAGASVLAVCPVEEKKPPVLAIGRLDKGRVAVFTGDTTRKWQQGPHVAGQESPYLRFWGQTVRWLAGRDEALAAGAGLTLSTDKSVYQPGEKVTLSAVVRDKEGKGVSKAAPAATIELPDGEESSASVAFEPIPGPPGRYRGTFESEQSGRHTIRASVQLDGETVQAEPVTIDVGRPSLEFERLAMDEEMLRSIAEASGGRYVHISTADYLIDSLDRAVRAETEQMELRLYSPLLFWILFVVFLSAEWYLRLRVARLS